MALHATPSVSVNFMGERPAYAGWYSMLYQPAYAGRSPFCEGCSDERGHFFSPHGIGPQHLPRLARRDSRSGGGRRGPADAAALVSRLSALAAAARSAALVAVP